MITFKRFVRIAENSIFTKKYMAKSVSKVRVEVWFTKSESHYIRKYLCKEGEFRKEYIERIIKSQIERAKKNQLKLF